MKKFAFILLLSVAACQAPLRSADADSLEAIEARIAAICNKWGLPANCTEYQLERAMLEKRALERAAMPPPSVTCEGYWERSLSPEIIPDRWVTRCN